MKQVIDLKESSNEELKAKAKITSTAKHFIMRDGKRVETGETSEVAIPKSIRRKMEKSSSVTSSKTTVVINHGSQEDIRFRQKLNKETRAKERKAESKSKAISKKTSRKKG